MARSRYVRVAASLMSSLLLQARNLVISVVVFRLFADPNTLWGTVNQVVAVVTLLALPAKFGLEFTAVQFVSKYRDQAPATALAALHRAASLRVALTVLAALPMLIVPSWVGPWIGMGDLPGLVQIGGLLLISSSLHEFGSFLLSGTDNFVGMMISRLVFALVNIGGVAWIAWQGLEDPAGPIVACQVLAGFAALAWSTWDIWRASRSLHDRSQERQDTAQVDGLFRDIVVFAVPVTLVSAAGQLFSYLDRVMIPVLASREELGSYAVAGSVVAAALFGTYAFRNIARTRLPALLGSSAAEAREALLATYRACFAVAVWICAGIVSVAPDLLEAVYGADAGAAADMLQWFIPFVILSAHANFSATALVAADRPRIYAMLMGSLSLLNFVLNLAFIPLLGGYGAILASSVSLVPLSLLSYRQVALAYGEDLWSLATVRHAIPSTLRITFFGLVAAVVGALVSAPGLVWSVSAGVVVTGLFAAALWIAGDVHAVRAAM